MRVSDTNRVVFVHVPKTGGSTIDLLFDDSVEDSRQVVGRPRHSTFWELCETESALQSYWSCAFIRNPWARMVSWWSMGVLMANRYNRGVPKTVRRVDRRPDIWEPLMRYADDFSRFILEGTVDVPRLRQPQLAWLTRPDGGTVDFVGRVENFVDDINVLRERLGLNPVEEVPHKNKSRHAHWSTYYTSDTRKRVANVFAADIEAFGYEFE